ncbi:ATP-binding cassette domain-containing protein [Allobranchiibius sp. GilTou38]|uniref:ATP-binding cassette domain-containing protein n=1 Tax=Allobranchiibius sp. GilTou38 TaxID=2815210 RepID=UPI001AA10609|nr:ATP-binding cassette domain-containing protein [Allobranchiibius sp. GilTou38]MBO1765763.1 ATP-binding cassette domain-containing protein [Allobranchiibius sp. GilTou38]
MDGYDDRGHAGDLTLAFPGGVRPLAPGESITVGRSRDCELSIPEAGASRRHVGLTRQGATVVASDLGSANGTWIDGRRITGPTVVPAGGVIRLGGAQGPTLQVRFVPAPAPQPSGVPAGQLPRSRPTAAPAPALAPSNTGVVFDRYQLPSGPMPERRPEPGGYAAVSSSVPQVIPAPDQFRPDRGGWQPSGPMVLGIGRGLENQIVLDDLLVSRRHTELVPQDGGFEVHDLGSRNGTYVNGQRVEVGRLGEGDLLAVGHSRFTVRHGQLVASVDQGDVAFIANHLSYALSDGKLLLDDVSFALPGSSLLAIIGPSGAGKSTMLKALTGSQPATSGEVYYDSRDLYQNFQDLRHRIGVVPQDDVVHRQLTVRQALRFAAELRFPDDLDAHLRMQRVEEVMAELGLSEHADTRVDRLSGGQRKRTSVALELLTRPSLLFLDEPTSGLDPGLDKQVMQTLRDLADGGRTVAVITHSVANLHVCDKVLLLAPGGRVAYFGPPDQLLPFFGARDHADVFNAVTADPGGVQHRFRTSPLQDEQVAGPLRAPRGDGGPRERPPRQQSITSQLSTLARRHVRVILADRGYAAFMVLLPIVLALLTTVVPGRYGLSFTTFLEGGQPIPRSGIEASQILVILILGSVFMGTAVSVRELVGERAIFKREKAVGLSSTGYVLAKLLIFGLLTLVQAVVLVLLVETRKAPPSSAVLLGSPTLELIIACWLTALSAMALGLLMSSVVRTSEQVMPLLVVSIMAQLVLCGGLFPVTGRIVLEQVSWLAPARWGFSLAAVTVDLDRFTLNDKDPLWQHTLSNGTLAASMLLLLTALFAGLTLWRLTLKTSE